MTKAIRLLLGVRAVKVLKINKIVVNSVYFYFVLINRVCTIK